MQAFNRDALPLGVIATREANHVVRGVVGNPDIAVGGCGDALKLTHFSVNGCWPEGFAVFEVKHADHVVEGTHPGVLFGDACPPAHTIDALAVVTGDRW